MLIRYNSSSVGHSVAGTETSAYGVLTVARVSVGAGVGVGVDAVEATGAVVDSEGGGVLSEPRSHDPAHQAPPMTSPTNANRIPNPAIVSPTVACLRLDGV